MREIRSGEPKRSTWLLLSDRLSLLWSCNLYVTMVNVALQSDQGFVCERRLGLNGL